MKYCNRCVIPDTRPGTRIGADGACNGCALNRGKDDGSIDWGARRASLLRLAERARRSTRCEYDCVVPVSGGKDSIYQLHVAKQELGLRPLAVSYQCACRTPVGEHNVRVVKEMADHVEFSLEERVRRTIARRSLEEVGDCCWVCHRLIFSYPIRIALRMGIPLVLYGENSQLEYGGSAEEAQRTDLDTDWLELHGVQHGRDERSFVDGREVTERDVLPLRPPGMDEIRAAGLRSLFLGIYLRWDSWHNLDVARSYGFRAREDRPPEGALHAFKDVDCEFMTFHHYFKWLKFGYSRVSDHASIDIRTGRMTREEALRHVAEREGEDPREYMEHFCRYLRISESRFWEIADCFRDPRIWVRGRSGQWIMRDFIAAKQRGWCDEDA